MARMDDMIKIKIVKDKPREKPKERPDPRPTPEYRKKTPPPEELYPQEQRKKPKHRYGLWIVALCSVAFLFFSLSYMFSSANVSITPKSVDVDINEEISAEKDSDTAPVSFDLMVISGEEVREVESSTQETVATPSKGTVVIYNTYSGAPQLLSVDTRLEGSNGKIYKTSSRITAPGKLANGDPGKVEVEVYASEPGPEYDSDPLDFKILGFKGTPKYEKIYGRSKGNISGGTKGEFYTLMAEERQAALKGIKTSLENKLLKKATEQIPPGFILFKGAAFVITNDDAATSSYSKDKTVPITLKGTLYGFLLEEGKLTKKIAHGVLEKYDGQDVYIPDIKDLNLELKNKETLVWSEVRNIDFTIKGKNKIVWKFDSEKFKDELLGKKKNEFNSILSKHPNVVSANVKLVPFWRMSFPDQKEKIKVDVNYPN